MAANQQEGGFIAMLEEPIKEIKGAKSYIEREVLVRRMKGWITVDPREAIDVVHQYCRLKVLDDRELVEEVGKAEDF